MRHCSAEYWNKIKIVRCGVDDAFLEAAMEPIPDAPLLVCVGRFCEQKGQLLLLEALKKISDEGIPFELVLVGDGEMRNLVERRIQEHGLKKKVRITGWVSSHEVVKHILASRAIVLPSFAEGLPVAVMEAFALGRPVISTFVAGIPELVNNNENGWLVPAGSVDDLVSALRNVLSAEPDQLSRMGAAGAALVLERHNALIEAKKLLSYFEA
jgi:glycosyltransferase involved in cell wall biosynthesis